MELFLHIEPRKGGLIAVSMASISAILGNIWVFIGGIFPNFLMLQVSFLDVITIATKVGGAVSAIFGALVGFFSVMKMARDWRITMKKDREVVLRAKRMKANQKATKAKFVLAQNPLQRKG